MTYTFVFVVPGRSQPIATHDLVENWTLYETKLLKVVDELKNSDKLQKKLVEVVKVVAGAKVTLEEEWCVIRVHQSLKPYLTINLTNKVASKGQSNKDCVI